jgi:hypothetical protein
MKIFHGLLVRYNTGLCCIPTMAFEYRLLRTKDGNWTSVEDGGFQVTPGDDINAEIKKAIDKYESQY